MNKFVTIGKSKQFYDFLKNEITSGEYRPGDKFPSIRELASKYGISNITVNSVISNLVTEGLLYVVQGRGTFVTDKKQDSKKKKRMIGVMFFDFSVESNVEAGMFNSIQENLKDDYYVIPYNSYNKLELFYKGIKGFNDLEVDGMILVPPTSEDYDPEIVNNLMAPETPVVFINRTIPEVKADYLSMDFELAVYKAARHLIDKKRKNIILLKSDSASLSRRQIDGYLRAYNEAGLECNNKFMLEWHKGLDKAEANLKVMIEEADGLIGSDVVIYRLRKAIYSSGKKIPEDLSIVGINDTVYARFMKPPLSAVPFPSRKIGEEAVKALMDRLENGRKEDMVKFFDTDIIIRESC